MVNHNFQMKGETGTFVSWNIRGVKKIDKRQMIFRFLQNLGPAMVCLQETHLTRDTTKLLKNRIHIVKAINA